MNEPRQEGRAGRRVLHGALAGCEAAVEWLCAQAAIHRWGLTRECFTEGLARSATKHFSGAPASPQVLEAYLRGLHIEDLALACACAEGHSGAWEHFVAQYRSGLRAAAAAIIGKGSSSAEARDLADSLFAELYGVGRRAADGPSLLRYYHGRSKLSTWLRTVLAQRHVDQVRERQRFESIDGEEDRAERLTLRSGKPVVEFVDPNKSRYRELLRRAFDHALSGLEARDRQRLLLYYVNQRTLAEIGKSLGEHESSVSRNLERIRKDLRVEVEEFLRRSEGPLDGQPVRAGLSEAQITLCFEYALEDAPFDLGKALGGPGHFGKSGPKP